MSQRECEFKGGHQFDMPYRKPVVLPVPTDPVPPADGGPPVPVVYWAVHTCKRCGYETQTAHGFTPRRNGEP